MCQIKFCLFIFFIGVQGIDRNAVISRAETWLNPPVPYSQSKYKDGYRTDCSGYVSMAWNLGTNYNTNTLLTITNPISKGDLQRGDILLNSGSHVVIFHSWANSGKTQYLGYEQVGGRIGKTKKWNIPYPYWGGASGYFPRRYKNIS